METTQVCDLATVIAVFEMQYHEGYILPDKRLLGEDRTSERTVAFLDKGSSDFGNFSAIDTKLAHC